MKAEDKSVEVHKRVTIVARGLYIYQRGSHDLAILSGQLLVKYRLYLCVCIFIFDFTFQNMFRCWQPLPFSLKFLWGTTSRLFLQRLVGCPEPPGLLYIRHRPPLSSFQFGHIMNTSFCDLFILIQGSIERVKVHFSHKATKPQGFWSISVHKNNSSRLWSSHKMVTDSLINWNHNKRTNNLQFHEPSYMPIAHLSVLRDSRSIYKNFVKKKY